MRKEFHNDRSTETPDVSGIANPDVAHEISDVSVKGISWFGLALFILIALVCVLMWWMFRSFARTERAAEPPPASRISETEPRLPPEPRLQGVPGHETLPQVDMKELRRRQEDTLENYGWIDEQSGVARIPIERAKDLLLEKGLPSRQTETDDKGGVQPSLPGGASNPGRRAETVK
jgi:hypothetical protein